MSTRPFIRGGRRLHGLGDASTQQSAIVRLPIINFEPPEGIEWSPTGYVALPAIGASATVVQRQIPRGQNAIMNFIANEFIGAGFQQGQGAVTWTLYLDFEQLIPAPNFNTILSSLGSVNAPRRLNGIRVKENQLLTLQVTNVSIVVAGQLIGGLLGGYDYPVDLEPVSMSF